MRKSDIRVATALSTVLALGTAAPAFAQDTSPPASDAGTNEIIVTAQRVEQRLQDVPISITVLNQQQISERNIVSTADLAAYVPSLSVNNQFGPEKASFVLRGFTQAYHTAPSVGVYFADVIAAHTLGPTTSGNGAGVGSLFDLENIQVLKGPQGTLFGRNTTGGAILLVPHKPTDKLEGYLEGTLGNDNERRIQGVLNVPLSDTFKIRGGFDWNKRDGYLHNHSGVGPKDFDNINYYAARLSIEANLTPDLENYTIFNISRSHTHGDVEKNVTCTGLDGKTLAQENPASLGSFFSPYACAQIARQKARGDNFWDVENNVANPLELIKQWQAINTTTWRASDNLTIKNIASYSEYRESAAFNLWGDNFLEVPGSEFKVPIGGQLYTFATPYTGTDPTQAALYSRTITLEPGFFPWTTAENSFTEEIQFQGHSSDNKFTWQAGGYLEIAKPLGWNSQLVDDFINCTNIKTFTCTQALPFGSISDANTKDYFNDKALFAQATYKVTDRLSFTGGIRYTWDKQRDLSQSLNVFVPVSGVGAFECQNILKFNTGAHNPPQPTDGLFVTDPSLCNVVTKISVKKPTWLIEGDYRPNDDMMFYAKWSRGFKPGSITANSVGFETVGPERLDLYEAGAKTSFRGAVSGYFNIAGFYNDFHDQQIGFNPTLLPQWQGVLPNASPNVNVGHSRIWGVEVDASATFFHQLKLDVGYTYLNTKVLQAIAPGQPGGPPLPVYYDPTKSFLSAQPGESLALSPKNTVVVTGTYMVPLDESVGKVSFGATFTHIDANNALSPDASPAYRIRAQNLLNLNVDWRSVLGKPIDLSFFMTNVTNQGLILFPGSAFNTIGIDGGHVNQPRMWGVRLKYSFGD